MHYRKLFQDLNLTTVEKFFTYANTNFAYGWLDQNHQMHSGINDAKTYCLQAPAELIESKIGICWDITELCRCWFHAMTNFQTTTYYIFYDDNAGCPSHTILTYQHNKLLNDMSPDSDKQFFWFEPMMQDINFCGVHPYSDPHTLLNDAVRHIAIFQQKFHLIPNNFNPNNYHIYQYDQPPYHINGFEMRNHINHSRKIQ